MVREERLELSHLAAPEPKSGVSTNSTTPALILSLHYHIVNHHDKLKTELNFYVSVFKYGWDTRIRTWECRDQNPVPYRLAISQ